MSQADTQTWTSKRTMEQLAAPAGFVGNVVGAALTLPLLALLAAVVLVHPVGCAAAALQAAPPWRRVPAAAGVHALF